MPEADLDMKDRCYTSHAPSTGAFAGGGGVFKDSGGMGRGFAFGGRGSRKTGGAEKTGADGMAANLSAEFQLSMSGLPSVARDFLARLPLAAAPVREGEIEVFIRHMKSVILPPRPSSEESGGQLGGGIVGGGGGDSGGDGVGGGMEGMDMGTGEDWQNRKAREGDEEEDEVEESRDDGDSDIFRRRQRARLG